ncbi:tdpoz4 [Trichonephila clavata]|uniref:Tdpoz4 n=1 Tax=Trichonephila clavata TaxID=2740835 RepID=A0A8X6K851_TRICU|nr:tdpoz4 [Trichonephila clavata]
MISSEDEYVIDWKIVNFSSCPLTPGKKLSTSELTFENLDNSTWEIYLYPRGKVYDHHVSCFLARTGKNDAGPKKIYVNFEFSLITSEGLQCEKTVMHDCNFFEPEMNLGFNIITREDLFANKKTYLWNDVLILRCKVGKYTPQTRQNCYNVFRTRNAIQTSNIRLPIENFENVTKSNAEFLQISTSKENDLLTLNVYTGKYEAFENDPEETANVKDGEGASNSVVHIDIERTKPCKTLIYPIYVFCRVKLVDNDKRFPFELADEHIYKGQLQKEIWNFPRFIKIKELRKDMIHDSTLLLDLNFCVCDGMQSTYLEEDLTPQKPKHIEDNKALKSDLGSLYKSGLFSDAKLKIGKKCLPVHKSILSIRSSVFKELFEEHAKKAAGGKDSQNDKECILNLTGISWDKLADMLNFIYTDVLDVKDFDSCLPLYTIAHEFDIPLMKVKCYHFLRDHMSVVQTIPAMVVAERLNDEDLKLLIKSVIKYSRESFPLEDFPEICQQVIHAGEMKNAEDIEVIYRRVSRVYFSVSLC